MDFSYDIFILKDDDFLCGNQFSRIIFHVNDMITQYDAVMIHDKIGTRPVKLCVWPL